MAGNRSTAASRRDSPSTQRDLLEDVRDRRNVEAWRSFVDRYTPLIYSYCRQRGLQEADAGDITQNVFFAVSRAMQSFEYDPDRGRFRSWLGTITCREIRRYLSWANRLRTFAAPHPSPISSLSAELESEWDTHFTAFLFQRAVQRVRLEVPADVWKAFAMLWFEDQAVSFVADQLDRPVPWVYKAKFRVLKRLRETVDAFSDELPTRPK